MLLSTVIWVVVLPFFSPVLSQSIRSNLLQCYNNSAIPGITEANNRPPSSLNILVELLRRIEDANPTLTTRDLSAAVIQRFLQSGIQNQGRTVNESLGVPFGINPLESYKSTLILNKFLTNTASTLYYGDLDAREICTLHYIISSNTDARIRGDESTSCTRSARYTMRIRRQAEATENPPVGESPDEVETNVENVETFGVRSLPTNERSQCPIELGVIYTNYGTVKAGPLLTGIATGFNYEREPVSQADNRYAATLAGELCEAALSQSKIGNNGGWNSTINPRYYFLQQNQFYMTTDAELRGALDGLFVALKVDDWKSKATIKMSQIVDMYYSNQQKGVFDTNFKACNRSLLFTALTQSDTLQQEIYNFMAPLDNASSYGTSFIPEAYMSLSASIYNTFFSYLPDMTKSDVACAQLDGIQRVATDLLIFLDSNWNYNTIQPLLSYVLDNIDVNRFHTRYTIISGTTGYNLTNNGTSHLLDYYKQYNLTTHQNITGTLNYKTVYETIENRVQSKLDNRIYAAGESTVALIITKTTPTDGDTKTFLEQKKQLIREVLPDLTVLVLGSGTQGDYTSITVNAEKDFVSLSETTNENDLKIIGQNVVDRIKNAPRAIVNPNCGSRFNGDTTTFSVTQYVELNGVNYYRIAPNYFYSGGSDRVLKITENSYGTIEVCTSRDQSRPSNSTSDCQTLRSSVRTININGYCSGRATDCAPIYLAVSGFASNMQCSDAGCRFPDEIKFTISMENVACYSGSVRIAVNSFYVALAVIFKLYVL